MNKYYIVAPISLALMVVFGLILYFSLYGYENNEEVQYNEVSISDILNTDTNTESHNLKLDQASLVWEEVINEKYGYKYYRPNNEDLNWFNVQVYFSTSTLAEYVTQIWNLNKQDTKTDLDKEVYPLEKTNINGKEAYQFVVSSTYTHDDYGSGYVLSSRKNIFTFFDTELGMKIVIDYPFNSYNEALFKRMIDSFIIDENIIPKKLKPENFKLVTVPDEGFSFAYPANIFTAQESYLGENYEWSRSFHNDKYGYFSVSVLNSKFDSSKIEGLYGVIDNPEIVSVGNRVAYSYLDGDAGCSFKKTLIALTEDKTLEFTASSCSGNIHPLLDEEELLESILDTFEFKQ